MLAQGEFEFLGKGDISDHSRPFKVDFDTQVRLSL
jgi:hypothetical protein